MDDDEPKQIPLTTCGVALLCCAVAWAVFVFLIYTGLTDLL